MKAAAIVAVVLIHSLRPFWTPGVTRLELFLSEVTRFAVPTFLAASGFLYFQEEPVTIALLARRFRRILTPYFCVSLAAYAYTRAFPDRLAASSLAEGLLFGSVFGPYYFVFLLAQFVLFTWVLSRLPRRALPRLLALVLGVIVVRVILLWPPERSGLADLTRNPIGWAPWFLLGWIAAAHRPRLLDTIGRHRREVLLACALAAAVWASLFTAGLLGGRAGHTGAAVLILAEMTALFTFGAGVDHRLRAVVALSDRTYAIYLLHPFFVYSVQDILQQPLALSTAGATLLGWAAGVGGSFLITALAQAALGTSSRDLVGA